MKQGLIAVCAVVMIGCGSIDRVGNEEPDVGQEPDAGREPDTGQEPDAPNIACPGDCARLGSAQLCLCEERVDWNTARADCAAEGLVLARVDDQDTSDVLRIESDRLDFPIWLGGTDAAVEGQWRWEHDDVLFWVGLADGGPPPGVFADFNAIEPNNDLGAENCLETVPGGWNDVPCDQTRPYACGPL